MREGLAQGRVTVGSVVGSVRVSLVVSARAGRASDGLAIGGGELGVDVDGGVDAAQVPGGTLATVSSAEVGVAVFGEDDAGGDAGVSADQA